MHSWSTHIVRRIVVITGEGMPISAFNATVEMAKDFCRHPEPVIYFGTKYSVAAESVFGRDRIILIIGPPGLTLDEFKQELKP